MALDFLAPRQLSLFDEPSIYESADLEFKAAKGGLPSSLWETYSAFANTSGGTIVLGVTETPGGALDMHGVSNPDALLSSLWSALNNRQKISANLLAHSMVEITEVSGKKFLLINVPRASRSNRPVYLNNKPFEETYRRDHSGDYRCSSEEVRRMFAINRRNRLTVEFSSIFRLLIFMWNRCGNIVIVWWRRTPIIHGCQKTIKVC